MAMLETYVTERVPIKPEDKEKSYFKYYLEELADVPQEKVDFLDKGPIDPSKAMKIEDRNDLFKPGYLDGELGYCIMEDGSAYVANLTFMPGVTVEMFDWWFVWHGLDDLRYSIWDPYRHGFARSQQPALNLNKSLSMRERLWGCTHLVQEDINLGVMDTANIIFQNPAHFGYEAEKIGTPACATIVCANVCGPDITSTCNCMTHFVREVEGGIELRSRFWMGYNIINGRPVKMIDGQIPEFVAKGLCYHNAEEFTNLARILPKIYAEEKDNW